MNSVSHINCDDFKIGALREVNLSPLKNVTKLNGTHFHGTGEPTIVHQLLLQSRVSRN